MVERRRYNFYSTRRFPFSKAPRAVVPSAPVALRAVGRGVLAPLVCHSHRPCVSFPRKRESSCFFLDCCLRRKDTVPPHPASLDGWPPSPARGEAYWVPAYARRTLWPPYPAVPWAPPASPAVGRGVLDSRLRGNDTFSCLRRNDTCWIPAYAGMTPRGIPKGAWVPAYAGRTRGPPHPASLDGWPPSPAVGRGVLGSCLCRNHTVAPSPGGALGTAGLSRKGRGGLGSCLRRKDTWGAGMTRCPLTRRCLGHRRPLPRWGEADWTAAFAGMTRGAQE